MSSSSKSRDNSCCSFLDNNDAIRPQFCTCHDSWAVGTCANLWPDCILRIKIKIFIFLQDFNHKLIKSLWHGSQGSLFPWSPQSPHWLAHYPGSSLKKPGNCPKTNTITGSTQWQMITQEKSPNKTLINTSCEISVYLRTLSDNSSFKADVICWLTDMK